MLDPCNRNRESLAPISNTSSAFYRPPFVNVAVITNFFSLASNEKSAEFARIRFLKFWGKNVKVFYPLWRVGIFQMLSGVYTLTGRPTLAREKLLQEFFFSKKKIAHAVTFNSAIVCIDNSQLLPPINDSELRGLLTGEIYTRSKMHSQGLVYTLWICACWLP